MTYTVLFKKFMETTNQFMVVEDVIEAATFNVLDGWVVFYDTEGTALRAFPPTFCFGIEPHSEKPLITT